jgi:hypothetical protein
MAMSHKAYAFEWQAFELGLRTVLERALMDRNSQELLLLIERERSAFKDPYGGEPLGEKWQATLENRDEQEVGDYALTRYYEPSDDFGLGDEWPAIDSAISASARSALLGNPIGPTSYRFDPGRQGSYFQTADQCRTSLQILGAERNSLPANYMAGLSRAVAAGLGMYQTF